MHDSHNAGFDLFFTKKVTSETTLNYVRLLESANTRDSMVRNDDQLSSFVELSTYLQTTVTSALTLH